MFVAVCWRGGKVSGRIEGSKFEIELLSRLVGPDLNRCSVIHT